MSIVSFPRFLQEVFGHGFYAIRQVLIGHGLRELSARLSRVAANTMQES
jgi:hypothetical protein